MTTNVAGHGTTVLGAGILAGLLWGLANLWALARLLKTWVSPKRSRSSWRVVGWLAAKFALLYPLAALFLKNVPGAAVGFGVGFTVMLVGVLAYVSRTAPRTVSVRHGR